MKNRVILSIALLASFCTHSAIVAITVTKAQGRRYQNQLKAMLKKSYNAQMDDAHRLGIKMFQSGHYANPYIRAVRVVAAQSMGSMNQMRELDALLKSVKAVAQGLISRNAPRTETPYKVAQIQKYIGMIDKLHLPILPIIQIMQIKALTNFKANIDVIKDNPNYDIKLKQLELDWVYF